MAKGNSTGAPIKESLGDTLNVNLNRTAREIGRAFVKASRNVDEHSVSVAAFDQLEKYAEMWQEIRSPLAAHAINSGFCQGVADELRRAGKGVSHG
jgi:hypothetical protein